MAQAQSQSLCVHQHYLNNNIHKLLLQADTNDAVDAAIQHMESILNEHDNSKPLLLLIDARTSGVPSVPYFLSSVRKLYSSRDELPMIRAAYLYRDNVLLALIQAFFDALRVALRMKAARRFFRHGEEIDAVKWLTIEEDSDNS